MIPLVQEQLQFYELFQHIFHGFWLNVINDTDRHPSQLSFEY